MKLMNRDKLSRSPKKSMPASIVYNNDDTTKGVQTFGNGDIYTGDFLDGKKHGYGVLKTQSNRTYDGSWENDLPHGFGVNTFPNGKIYKGEYKKGKPFGEGQWIYSDGSTYTGKWINGEFVNPDNKQDTFQFRIVTFLINILVIGFMLSVIGFWLLKFFRVI